MIKKTLENYSLSDSSKEPNQKHTHTYKFHRTLFQIVAMDNLHWNYLGCLKISIHECYKRPIGVMPQESFFKKEK